MFGDIFNDKKIADLQLALTYEKVDRRDHYDVLLKKIINGDAAVISELTRHVDATNERVAKIENSKDLSVLNTQFITHELTTLKDLITGWQEFVTKRLMELEKASAESFAEVALDIQDLESDVDELFLKVYNAKEQKTKVSPPKGKKTKKATAKRKV